MGKYEVFKGKGKKKAWRWHLKARNGRIIAASSGAFVTMEEAKKEINDVRKNTFFFGTYDVWEGKGKHPWRWHLKDSDGKILAKSGEGFKAKQGTKTGISSVRRNALFSRTKILD